jgi:hypothetical protein
MTGSASGHGLTRASSYNGELNEQKHSSASVGHLTDAASTPFPTKIYRAISAVRCRGEVQRHGSIWLVQNSLPCMPGQLEGCERRADSYRCCLHELPVV